jgi:pimeloyl-ACP methyl ester carboxylesterase
MLQLLLIGYVVVVLLAVIFQRRLIYFPTKLSSDLASQTATERGFLPWTNHAGQIIGWKIPAAGAPEGNALIIHGNAGCAVQRDYLAQAIYGAALLEVYVLEYPGYGARDGSPSLQSLLAAGEEALATLPKNRPTYVVSESIGAGVATHLAGAHPTEIAGLVLFAPYDNLAWVAQRKMPLLPAYFVLLDRFQPAKWLKNYRGPVKIVLAEADEVIPPESGRRLYDGYTGPKELQVVPHARHNDVAEQPPEWWLRLLEFWQANRHS